VFGVFSRYDFNDPRFLLIEPPDVRDCVLCAVYRVGRVISACGRHKLKPSTIRKGLEPTENGFAIEFAHEATTPNT
jgi:hypothetical protein